MIKTKNINAQAGQVMVDQLKMTSKAARAKSEVLIFNGARPADMFERAARKSFMDCVMELMKDGGQLVKL